MAQSYIYSTSDSSPDSLIITEDGSSVLVRPGVVLGAPGYGLFQIEGRQADNLTIQIAGSILGQGAPAIDLFTSDGSEVTVTATGRVSGAFELVVQTSYGTDLINDGTIETTLGVGVFSIEPFGGEVINRGRIFGEVGGVNFNGIDMLPGNSARLENTGTIEAGHGTNDLVFTAGMNNAVYSHAEQTNIVNSGTIRATDLLGAGIAVTSFQSELTSAARIENSGTVISTQNWGISFDGLIGTSNLVNSGRVEGEHGALRGGGSTDSVQNTGTFVGVISLGAGADHFVNGQGGAIDGIDLGAGADVYDASAGDGWARSAVLGGAGGDLLLGSSRADDFSSGAGGDTLSGGRGTDRLDGGSGVDTVLYLDNTTTVRIDLTAGRASFPGQSWPAETLISIENARTGSGDDMFIGNAASNYFMGGAGADTFDGRGATDRFDGGTGSDTVLYQLNDTPVMADLATGRVSFPGQNWGVEHLTSIENIVGGIGNDTLLGSSAANTLRGGAGYDVLQGRGGADVLIGGERQDVFRFAAVTDSAAGAADTLAGGDNAPAFDLSQSTGVYDTIDLSRIDALVNLAGNQAFTLGAVGQAGGLWLTNSGTSTVVHADVGAAGAEFRLVIADGTVLAGAYAAENFLL